MTPAPPPVRWAILTGEYPPQAGGVADYTRLVAGGLAAAGDGVTVYAPACAAGEADTAGVSVVRLPDHFGPRGLAALDHALARSRPDRVLVQYVPHAFGWKGLNLPFAAWVGARAPRLAPVWVMFHEVAYPFGWRALPSVVLGTTHAVMARLVAGAAARVLVSIPGWERALRRACPGVKAVEWLPVPCTVGAAADPAAVGAARAASGAGPGDPLVGHFGTFGPLVTDLLAPAAGRLLRRVAGARLALIGRGADGFRARFAAGFPDLAGRVTAAGELPAAAVAAHLRACDVVVQPYPDGASCRRTTLMAGLANGVPVVSNLGRLSESVWPGLGCVALAPGPDPAAIALAAEGVIALPPAARAALGARAAGVYRERFGLGHTLAKLRGAP